MDSTTKKLRESRFNDSQRPSDARREFERDYGRLIHSPSFRRLQGKSQVFGAGSGDYYRTRLTHSLEVAQITRSVASHLLDTSRHDFIVNSDQPGWVIDPVVVECAAIAHDMGHPPFGHKGEEVLDHLLIRNGYRYEGNAQNFRILTFLEKRLEFTEEPVDGLNLTAAVLLATNKYPIPLEAESDESKVALMESYRFWNKTDDEREKWLALKDGRVAPPKLRKKGLYPREWRLVDGLRQEWKIPDDKRTLEAQLMDLCDDIAYSTHDIEDGVRAGKIRLSVLDGTDLQHGRIVKSIAQELEKERSKDPGIWPESMDIEQRVAKVFKDYADEWRYLFEKAWHDDSRTRRELKARWVNRFVTKVGIVDDGDWKRVAFVDRDGQCDIELHQAMMILKKLAWVTLVQDFRIQRLQERSELILKGLWHALRDQKHSLSVFPSDWAFRYQELVGEEWPWERFVADYLAGFTDSYAERVYAELYGTRVGSIYDVD